MKKLNKKSTLGQLLSSSILTGAILTSHISFAKVVSSNSNSLNI